MAIVGAGFTGLWTAYYLKKLEPSLAITIVEAEHVGFGASGRNGGWVIPGIAGLARYTNHLDASERQRCCDLLTANVGTIGRTLTEEGIDADFHKGGCIAAAARYPDQVEIQKHHLEDLHTLGYREDACYWLSADALAEHISFNNGLGGIFHRDFATIHPGKLVAGLAETVENMGVVIHENSRVHEIDHNVVVAERGRVHAPMIVTATEGYSRGLPLLQKYITPVQSLIIATEPLPPEIREQAGMANRPAFADASRQVNYGHCTADGRIIFGARGGYRYGGKPRLLQAITDEEIQQRRQLLIDLIPALEDINVDYGWGGSVGLSRRFRPHAIVNRDKGLATAGGYAGEGVAAAHLFARTLAELIVDTETQRTEMPWAFRNERFKCALKRWEFEPTRWLGTQLINGCYAWEDTLMRRKSPARWRKAALGRINSRFSSLIE